MKEKDIHSIESIQRRATKMIPGLTDMTYEERLKTLKLPTLVYRRMRGDIIEAYKLVTKKYDLSKELLHPATYKSTRGNTQARENKKHNADETKLLHPTSCQHMECPPRGSGQCSVNQCLQEPH